MNKKTNILKNIFYYYNKDGLFWFRLFGYGISIKDLNKQRLYFSERYGYTKHLIIGNYSVAILKHYRN